MQKPRPQNIEELAKRTKVLLKMVKIQEPVN